MTIVSQSELRTWMQCNRRHWYSYVRGIEPRRTPSAFLQGTVFHDALSDYYAGVDESGVLARADALLSEQEFVSLDGEYRDADEWDRGELLAAKMRGVVRAYAAVYPRDEFPRVASVEERFAVRLDDAWTLSGRFDGVVQDEQGRWWLLEHKTSSGDAIELLMNLRLDFQVGFYLCMCDLLAAEDRLPQVAGVLYNIVVKPQLRAVLVWEASWEDQTTCSESKSAAVCEIVERCSAADPRWVATKQRRQTPEEYERRIFDAMRTEPGAFFHRRHVMRSEQQREAFRRDLDTVLAAFAGGAQYPNLEQCDRCVFRTLCGAAAEDRPGLIETFFQPRRTHV